MPKGTGDRGIDDKVRTLAEAVAVNLRTRMKEQHMKLFFELHRHNIKTLLDHSDWQAARIAELEEEVRGLGEQVAM